MHWFPVLERTEQHVACKGAGMHMYVVMEQAMIGKTPDTTLAIYSLLLIPHCQSIPNHSFGHKSLLGAFHNCITLFQNWSFCIPS